MFKCLFTVAERVLLFTLRFHHETNDISVTRNHYFTRRGDLGRQLVITIF